MGLGVDSSLKGKPGHARHSGAFLLPVARARQRHGAGVGLFDQAAGNSRSVAGLAAAGAGRRRLSGAQHCPGCGRRPCHPGHACLGGADPLASLPGADGCQRPDRPGDHATGAAGPGFVGSDDARIGRVWRAGGDARRRANSRHPSHCAYRAAFDPGGYGAPEPWGNGRVREGAVQHGRDPGPHRADPGPEQEPGG